MHKRGVCWDWEEQALKEFEDTRAFYENQNG